MSAVQVRAAVEAAFRDFEIGGVPSSGAHEPVKSEIRFALGRLLESVLSSIGAGIERYATKAAMDADTTRADGTLAYVWDDANPANNNVYQWDGAAWVVAAWYFTAVAGVVQPLVDDAQAARDEALAIVGPLSGLEKALRDEGFPLDTISATDTVVWSIAAGFGGVAFVVDGADLLAINPSDTVSTLRAYVQAGAGASRVKATLYQRPIAQADSNPGAAAGDVVLSTIDAPLSDFNLEADGAMVEVDFEFPPQTVDELHSYMFAVEMFDEANARKVTGFASGPAPGGKPARYRGFYRSNPAGVWGIIAGNAAPRVWLYSTYIDMRAVVSQVNDNTARLDKVDRSFETQLFTLGTRTGDGTYFPAIDAHYRWIIGAVVGTDVAAGQDINTVSSDFELSATINKVLLRIWERETDPGTDDDYPGTAPGDTLIFSQVRTLADLDVVAEGGYLQTMLFPFGSITTEAGKTYFFEWTFYNAANVTQGAGMARNFNVPGLTQEQRGFYDAAGAIADPLALAWSLGYGVYVVNGGGGTASAGKDVRDRIETASAEVDGYDVTVTGDYTRAAQTSGFVATVTLAAPASGNVVDEAVTLSGTVAHRYYTAVGVLAHGNVSAVVVKDATTNAVLILDTDYRLEANTGVVSRAAAGADRPVKVSYHWSRRRYDLICVHAETRALSVVAGTVRDLDASEFLPVPANSAQIPLFYARVTDGLGIECIPVWYLDGNIHRDLIAQRNADYENQRRALEPLLRKARLGQTIKVAAMGDSIGAVEGGYSPTDTPNTPARDRTNYFLFNIGADRVAQLPLYDQGDGAGAVHTHLSSPWSFVEALRDLGATVEYYNFCIGGTGSGPGARNGGDPVLRNAAFTLGTGNPANKPDVLVTHYGMNETGSDATEGQLRDLFDAAYALGICVFAIGQPRPGSIKPYTIEGVRKTWRATRRAAEFYNAQYKMRGAYFEPARVVDDGYYGAIGASLKDLGAADSFHHTGIREFEIYGREIRALLRGE